MEYKFQWLTWIIDVVLHPPSCLTHIIVCEEHDRARACVWVPKYPSINPQVKEKNNQQKRKKTLLGFSHRNIHWSKEKHTWYIFSLGGSRSDLWHEASRRPPLTRHQHVSIAPAVFGTPPRATDEGSPRPETGGTNFEALLQPEEFSSSVRVETGPHRSLTGNTWLMAHFHRSDAEMALWVPS